MSEDLTALAQDVRRSAQLVRDLAAEAEQIRARLVEIEGTEENGFKGQYRFAEIALEDARKRLEGTEDEPADPIEAEAKSKYDEADKLAHPPVTKTLEGNSDDPYPFATQY